MTQVIVKPETAANLKRLLQTAVDYQMFMLKIGIDKTTQRLKTFEQQFEQESLAFYQAFQAGEAGDGLEYIKWAGEYETLLRLQQDYHELVETQLC